MAASTPVMIEPLVGKEPSPSDDIDRQVKELAAAGQRLYRLDESSFRNAQPDLILTQDLCHVCAVTPDQLNQAIRSLPTPPQIVTLNPTTLEDIVHDVERIANAADRPALGSSLPNLFAADWIAYERKIGRAHV